MPSIKTLLTVSGFLLFPLMAEAADQHNIRGGRYCEVVVAKGITQYAVYNTFGVNRCPGKIWKKVTLPCVKKETGKSLVHLNGPRYWVIDGFEQSTLISETPRTICGLTMREAGVLTLSLFDLVRAHTPYLTHEVKRHTTWVFDAGKPVYELIDNQGRAFVMQSYSVQDVAQTQASLSSLGSKLHLPSGWTFKTGEVTHTQKLPAVQDKAVVLQDELGNTYQMASHDFLKSS